MKIIVSEKGKSYEKEENEYLDDYHQQQKDSV